MRACAFGDCIVPGEGHLTNAELVTRRQRAMRYGELHVYTWWHLPTGAKGTREFIGTLREFAKQLAQWQQSNPGVWCYAAGNIDGPALV